jgi:hypothetical protein
MVLEFGFDSSSLCTFYAFSYTEIPFNCFVFPNYKKLSPAPSMSPLQLTFEFFADVIFHYTLKFKV